MTDTSPRIEDGCPPWADKLLRQIHELEARLGNVRTPGDWKSVDMERLMDRLRDDLGKISDEEAVERLFAQVAGGLTHDGLQPAQIVAFANARIGAGGRLPYCNEAEVRELLSTT